MEYTDKTLICVDCEGEFIHSADDQARYAERGFTNEPKRCRPCREKRKKMGGGGGGGGHRGGGGGGRGGFGGGGGMRSGPRELFKATCSECGVETEVPFQPKEGRPVYCRDCYRSKKPGGPSDGPRHAEFD